MRQVTVLALSLAVCAAFAPLSAHAQGGPPPMPSGGPPPMPQAPSAQYYYNDNGKQSGPFTLDQIKGRIAAGAITADTLIWKSGMPNWVAMKDIPELGRSAAAPVAAPVAGGAACSGPTSLIADDFSETEADQTQSFDSGKLKFKALAGKFDWFTYKYVISGDADICVTVQIPHKMGKPEDTFAGVMFGSSANGDFHAFLISPNGNASVLRFRGKDIDLPISWHRANGLDTTPGAKNRVHITVKGGVSTFYVNDTQFGTFNGPLPNNSAAKLGVIVKSEAGKRDTWKFINFRATTFQ